MKHSRIFLGATTCMLAIAGVAAAKMHKFFTNVTRYYCTSPPTALHSSKNCVPYALTNCLSDGGITHTCKYVTTLGKIYTLYTNQVGSDKICHFSSPTSCTTVIQYDVLQ